MIKMIFFVFLLLTTLLGYASGPEHAGMVVKREGSVEIYKPVTDDKASVLYEGKHYSVDKVKLGAKVFMNDIIKTGSDGKLKIVYKNGDQYNVGENTFYEVNWDKSKYSNRDVPTVKLMFGKIRAVISKEGPRKELQVKTKVAALGVRGTDFYVENNGIVRGTDVSVLRGEVAVSSNEVKSNLPDVKVTQGFTAQVKSAEVAPVEAKKTEESVVTRPTPVTPVPAPKLPSIELIKTSQEELVVIQQASVVKEEKIEKEELTEVVKVEIESLEKKAVESVVQDIKTHDPKLLMAMDLSKMNSSDVINTKVVEEVFKEAPKAPAKARFRDLDESGEDPYKKYFKIED